MRIRKTYRADNDVTLYHGDCLQLLRKLPDAAAQLVVTSPPYNVGKEYEKSVTIEEYLNRQSAVIAECVRITRPGGSICWQVGNHVNGHGQIIPLDILLHPLFVDHVETDRLRLRNRLVWHFEHGLNCKQRFSGRHETILWYTKGDNYIFNLDAVRVPQKYPGKRAYKGEKRGQYSCHPLGKNPGDVWVIPNVKSNHVEKTLHPCQFPIEIPERLILALSNEDDLIVDPFLGVGTTAVAAVLHGRRAAGADISKDYLAVARQRITAGVNGRLKRRPFGKPVYQPRPNTPLTISPFGTAQAAASAI
jgi:adenine-specific DNA-methyltransferase